MVKKIFMGLVFVVLIFVGVAMMQPDDFKISRSIAVAASPQKTSEQVNDFRNWQAWSPWAKLDPNAKATFEGPVSGEGAVFKWAGNQEVGEGSNTIIESRPGELVKIRLDFLKPFQATNTAEFTFVPDGEKTIVTWSMYGKNNFVGKAMGLIMNCDKMVGGQFEKGLAQLKSVVENQK
jgi:hypothetical protein